MKISNYLCKQHCRTFLSKLVKMNYGFPIKHKNSICKTSSLFIALSSVQLILRVRYYQEWCTIFSHGTCTKLLIHTHLLQQDQTRAKCSFLENPTLCFLFKGEHDVCPMFSIMSCQRRKLIQQNRIFCFHKANCYGTPFLPRL